MLRRLWGDRPLIYRVEGTTKGYVSSVPAPAPSFSTSLGERSRRPLERILVLENDLMDRLAWRRSDALVVKSGFTKRDLVTLYGVDPAYSGHDRASSTLGQFVPARSLAERTPPGHQGRGRRELTPSPAGVRPDTSLQAVRVEWSFACPTAGIDVSAGRLSRDSAR